MSSWGLVNCGLSAVCSRSYIFDTQHITLSIKRVQAIQAQAHFVRLLHHIHQRLLFCITFEPTIWPLWVSCVAFVCASCNRCSSLPGCICIRSNMHLKHVPSLSVYFVCMLRGMKSYYSPRSELANGGKSFPISQ